MSIEEEEGEKSGAVKPETSSIETDQKIDDTEAVDDESENNTTISGNNPFRKTEKREEEDPEKYAHVFTTIHDEDFDANATIYPEPLAKKNSDDEDELSSGFTSDSSNEMSKLKRIRIRDKNKENEDPLDLTDLALPAPPKVTQKAFQEELTAYEDEYEFGSRKKTKVERKEADNPWTESMDEEEQKEKRENLLKTFENTRMVVDWQAPVPRHYATAIPTGTPQAILPDLPRCETPDSDLEIPFHENKDDTKTWRVWTRYPEKKSRVKQMTKYTSDRTWKDIAVKLSEDRKRCVINLYNIEESGELSSEPYKSIRLEPYMQLSRDKLQQYDKYGKVHIFKLNHVSYKEILGIRPEKVTLKTIKTLVSHKPKQNVALDHIPIYTEILKFGSLDHAPLREMISVLEDKLMDIPSYKMAGLNYNDQEVSAYVIDEYHAEMDEEFKMLKQKSRTRIFCSAFVNGGPNIVLGINDKWRIGREVVRRADILPIMNDDWISIKKTIFHSCVDMEEYEKDHMIKFYALDGCKFELMRFRTTLVKNPEFPLITMIKYSINQRFISIRCDLTVPGYFTACRHRGAVPCENVEIHIPIPEEWIYHFRIEKHNKMGSVHSVLRKPGKIKGFERITQLAQSFLPPSILETSIGDAKYEHLYKSIVWRINRVPEKNEASYKPHLLTCRFLLEPHDPMPDYDTLVRESHVEFTMPSSTVSGCVVRSISVESTGVVEKFVKYTSKYFYTVGIKYELGERPPDILKSVLDEEDNEDKSKDQSEEEDSSNEELNQSSAESENSVEIKQVKPAAQKKKSESSASSTEEESSSEEEVKKVEKKKPNPPKTVKKASSSSSEESTDEKKKPKKKKSKVSSSSSSAESSSSSESTESSSSSSSEDEKDKKKKQVKKNKSPKTQTGDLLGLDFN